MSDRPNDLSKRYEEDVLIEEHPRSIGLFTIPEYPELEVGQGMWSVAFDAILTTLRYLAPATILTLFWGQQSFIFKLLKHIDATIRSIIFSSEEQKQEVLKWLSEEGPVRVEKLDLVWRQGWILCGVLDAALPGACAGHPQTSLSLKHAQTIADHYLGVEPVFSRQELDSNDSLGKHQEWKLATYLDRIRQALAKLTPPVSKPNSQRTSPETTQFTLDYIAKGSGLKVAQVNNKMYFKIYPTLQQSVEPGEITVLIRGPRDTYGMTVLPPILGKAQIIRQKLLGIQTKTNFTENILPLTQGATYLRNFGRNDMNKTYYIPKAIFDIEIEIESSPDNAKIGYIVKYEGTYEISITSRGQNVVGSPFIMKASRNMINILEKEGFFLEDGEEIDIIDEKTDKKVVLRIVDFVTEKMLLKENGSLVKISEDEAKILMTTEKVEDKTQHTNNESLATTQLNIKKNSLTRFQNMVSKIITLKKICSIFNELSALKGLKKETLKETCKKSISKQNVPDIVNSIIQQKKSNIIQYNKTSQYETLEKIDKYIIPENISVSLRTEKPTLTSFSKEIKDDVSLIKDNLNEYSKPKNADKVMNENLFGDNVSEITPTSSNPFYSDIYKQNYKTDKKIIPFVTTEHEENDSNNEVTTHETPINISTKKTNTMPTASRNPFLEPDIINLERPKTPILKIISGEVTNRYDSGYVEPNSGVIAEELINNEFINPFFIHHLHGNQEENSNLTTDFIIGAPVSLPPLIKASTPEPNIESIIISPSPKNYYAEINDSRGDMKDIDKKRFHAISNSSLCNTTARKDFDSPISSFHSLDTDGVPDNIVAIRSKNELHNVSLKKEIWDSAYVSIDDNSSPDSNNNESNSHLEVPTKLKHSLKEDHYNYKREDFTNIGPAEKEIWDSEFNKEVPKQSEDVRFGKWEIKRPTFTPIIEENDRSISTGNKHAYQETSSNNKESDYISVAFAELNNMYHEYFPDFPDKSSSNINEDLNNYNLEKNPLNEIVDSASELETDVMRHANKPEGMISEVQANVTESVSASQPLYVDENHKKILNETQFGGDQFINIVQQKKKFWDDKIQQIQAKTEEVKPNQKKKRPFSKPLKHNDSLTKKKGKHIIKNFLNAGETKITSQSTPIITDLTDRQIDRTIDSSQQDSVKKVESDAKLVNKWKTYWDEKLETEKNVTDTFSVKTPQRIIHIQTTPAKEHGNILTEHDNDQNDRKLSPVKQELSEEVFKAFETSPKRFFGTSRKQILSKIDSFLGKPNNSSIATNFNNLHHDSGLVSSRISLFHSITKKEEMPLQRRKCQSLQNINQRKNSNRSIDFSTDTNESQFKNNENLETIQSEKINESALEEKRTRLTLKTPSERFEEPSHFKPVRENLFTKNATKILNNDSPIKRLKQQNPIRKTSISKSETDIFNKMTNRTFDKDFDKYKSCEELPKINVKNFISLYETVTKAAAETATPRKSLSSPKNNQNYSSHLGAVPKHIIGRHSTPDIQDEMKKHELQTEQNKRIYPSITKTNKKNANNNDDTGVNFSPVDSKIPSQDVSKNVTYLSLSDIELEIIENSSDKSKEPSPERDATSVHAEYKSRFKMAKQYFQSLEELREEKGPSKLNECEMLLYGKKSNESPEEKRSQKRVKKNIKSHSMPSSEISKIWNQMQETQESRPSESKPVKISEKFNVEDLFNDVMEGRLSRQGSLRGIPHKKAVLETFRSMENVSNSKLNTYEISDTQFSELTTDNKVHKNAQTFLTEYPYLPTTDPSKYHSRLDAKASGLISMKELLSNKPRRNSVPDLRLNPAFTVNL